MNKCFFGGNRQRLCKNYFCDFCFGKSFASRSRSNLWHPSLNGDITPRDVSAHNRNPFWFYCNVCKHEYTQSLEVASRGKSCLFCIFKRLCTKEDCERCFNRSFASHPLSNFWSYEKNNFSPREITKYSTVKVWFHCEMCQHDYEKTLDNVTRRNEGCPYCLIPLRVLCKNPDCEFCYNNSFASHERSKYWYFEKNKLLPREVTKGSEIKYYFLCPDCGHVYHQSPYYITKLNHGCHYCKWCILCDNETCLVCHDKSFASSPYANNWSWKNPKTARQTSLNCNDKAIFFCDKCNHEFQKTVAGIRRGFCPFCSERTSLCSFEECRFCYLKSIASDNFIMSRWSNKNVLNPYSISLGSGKEIILVCPYKHEYKRLAYQAKKFGCSLCKNITEGIIYEELKPLFPNITKEEIFPWCYVDEIKFSTIYRFDFYIPQFRIIIELDGGQHFKQVMDWQTPQENRLRDVHKMKLALSNNISIIRVLGKDVYFGRNNWKDRLLEVIKEYSVPRVIYLTETDIYKDHIQLYENNTIEELIVRLSQLKNVTPEIPEIEKIERIFMKRKPKQIQLNQSTLIKEIPTNEEPLNTKPAKKKIFKIIEK
jgi:hypothetical protein